MFNYVDNIKFGQSVYEVCEDKGSICVNLTLHKPAFFDTTVQVCNDTITGKLCTYVTKSVCCAI